MRVKDGYILLESIVSMGLLSICMLAIYGGMRDATLMRGLSEDFTTARFLLEEKALEHELQPELVEGSGSGQFPSPHERFTYDWEISRVEIPIPPPPPGLTDEQVLAYLMQFVRFQGKLSVTVRWQRAGFEQEITAETLLRPGQLWEPMAL